MQSSDGTATHAISDSHAATLAGTTEHERSTQPARAPSLTFDNGCWSKKPQDLPPLFDERESMSLAVA